MSGEFKKLFDLEKLEQMVNAHVMQFGVEPYGIQIPAPDFVYRGIKVHFANSPSNLTFDKDRCFHHHFTKEIKK